MARQREASESPARGGQGTRQAADAPTRATAALSDAAPDAAGSPSAVEDAGDSAHGRPAESQQTRAAETGSTAVEAETAAEDAPNHAGSAGESSVGPGASPARGPESFSVELPDFGGGEAGTAAADRGISLIQDVDLRVKIELGRTRMLIEDVLALGPGSVVELDKLAGDPVDVFVNDRLIARGEVLVLNDNFCVRISEIVSHADARRVG